MSMEKPIGNVRHSHDNLLAQAAWAAHGQAIEGTLGRMYSRGGALSRGAFVGLKQRAAGVFALRSNFLSDEDIR
jgi:hypothetical protein